MTDDRSRHDFKNQLAIIRGFAELLIAEAAPGDPRRCDLEEIYKASVTALAMLDHIYSASAESRDDGVERRPPS